MNRNLRTLSGIAAVVLLSAATAATAQFIAQRGDKPSRSKLSLHLLGGNYTAGAKLVVAERPRLLKIFDLGADMRVAMKDFKGRNPNGVLVLRLWTPVRYPATDNPESSAERYWIDWIWPRLTAISASERKLIDYVEGPNEGDNTPTWGSDDEVRWFARFWVRLATLMKANGIRPCVGSVPVGNPGSFETRWPLFMPALQAAQNAKGAWSYHAYTLEYSTNVGVENWYSLRYRQLVAQIRPLNPGLSTLPLILSEGGVDQSGNGATSGWQARGTANQYKQWLSWFDTEIRKDSYVIGVTLFQSGDANLWPSFDTEPINPWLADYIRQNR